MLSEISQAQKEKYHMFLLYVAPGTKTMIVWYNYKQRMFEGAEPEGEVEYSGWGRVNVIKVHYMYESSIMKPIKKWA
jgi:hypothetical protein